MAKIEKQLSEEKFGFERMRDIYDRTEKYLVMEQQDERRGRALVVLISSLPLSQLRSDLLSIVAIEAKSKSVAAKAADTVVSAPPPKLDTKRFFGKIIVEWISEDQYIVEIDETFWFIDSKGIRWTVPKGTKANGASIPRMLWPSVGSPLGGRYLAAAVLHEHYSTVKTRTAESVNQMFFEALVNSAFLFVKHNSCGKP